MTMTTSTSRNRTTAERRPAAPELSLVAARDSGAEPLKPTAVQKARFDRPSILAATGDGRAFAVVRPKKQPPRFLFTQDDAIREVEDWDLPHEEPLFVVREDYAAILLAFSQESLWEVTFAEKSARKLAPLGDSLYGVAYGADNRVIVAEGSHLRIFRRTDTSVELERRVQIGSYLLASLKAGRILATVTHDSDGHYVVLLGWHEGALHRLGRVKGNADSMYVQNGRLFVRSYETREVLGIDALFAAFEANPSNFEVVGDAPERRKVATREPGAFAVEAAEGGVSLKYAGTTRPKEMGPNEIECPRDAARLLEYTNEWVVVDEDTVLGWKRGKGQKRFCVYDGGRFIESELRVKDPSAVMTMRWDRVSCLATTTRDTKLWMVDLRHGRMIPVASFEDEQRAVAFAAGGLAVSVSPRGVSLCGVEGRRPGIMARSTEIVAEQISELYSGRVLALASQTTSRLRIWGVYDETLKELANFALPSCKLHVREGRVCVEIEGGEWYEVVGFEAAHRADRGTVVELTPER
jgi:hypothetical protein